jgi:hypothetical protein
MDENKLFSIPEVGEARCQPDAETAKQRFMDERLELNNIHENQSPHSATMLMGDLKPKSGSRCSETVIFPESAFPPRGTAFDFGAAV